MAFFSEVQSWLCADFGGRYIGKIILEWEKDDRAGFKSFIRNELSIDLASGYRLEEEFVYKKSRRADLAVFCNDQDAEPIALIELKWNDSLIEDQETGQSQIKDYVEYCLQHKECRLLVLTKDTLTNKEYSSIHKLSDFGRHSYFGVLLIYLRKSQSSVANMFLAYLQDKGMVMNDIDQGALFRFFHRFVNPRKGARRAVSEDQLSSGPDQFKNMLNNMSLIAQDISPVFFDIQGQKATIDFAVFPLVSKKYLSDALSADEKSKNDYLALKPEAKVGGEIYIFAAKTIGKAPKPWLQIEYGFRFDVETNKEHELDVSMYAYLNGAKINWTDTEIEKSESLIKKLVFVGSKKAEIVVIFKQIICEAINKYINNNIVDSDVKKELKTVMARLSGK